MITPNPQSPTPNAQLIVIADDITGAAEIAGIGLAFGLKVNLVMYTGKTDIAFPETCDLLVIATDTRSKTQLQAKEETALLCEELLKIRRPIYLFKKVDSVLRGHIIPELKVMIDTLGKKHALLLPQNPSRQRTIRDGIYYIGTEKLHWTDFFYDPEFPAHTSDVGTLLGILRTEILSVGRKIKRKGIHLAEATQLDEVLERANELDEDTLPAGGADFFRAYLRVLGYEPKTKPAFNGLSPQGLLIVLGSTAKHGVLQSEFVLRHQIPNSNTPALLFYREAPKQWIEKAKRKYAEKNALIIHTDYPTRKGKEYAIKLREGVGKAVEALLNTFHPKEIVIEGGATAFTILSRMQWDTFTVESEISPGVIRLNPIASPGVTVTLKPGSYPWGGLFG